MKNNLHLIIIYFLIATPTCIAMENLDIKKYIRFEQPKILSEITIIKEPWQAEYLDEDRILINGKDGCCIIDPRTNREIKRIEVQAPHFAIHPTTKKIAFAGEKPAIYSNTGDLETFIQKENSTSYTKCVFNPLYNDVLLQDSSCNQSYNYETGNRTKMKVKNSSLFAFHPTEKIYYRCQPDNYVYAQPTIEVYKSCEIGNVVTEPFFILLDKNCNPTHMLCSPNGSLIAVKDKDKAVEIIKKNLNDYTQTHRIKLTTIKNGQHFISNPITNTRIIIDPDGESWIYMKFHNNSAVLATVLLLVINYQPHRMVFYWDTMTQKLLATTPAFRTIDCHNACENIAFSPDGTKIMIALPDKCVILPVPVEVLYNTTEKLPCLYWLLSKECLAQHDIPDDVQKTIAFDVLEKFKR